MEGNRTKVRLSSMEESVRLASVTIAGGRGAYRLPFAPSLQPPHSSPPQARAALLPFSLANHERKADSPLHTGAAGPQVRGCRPSSCSSRTVGGKEPLCLHQPCKWGRQPCVPSLERTVQQGQRWLFGRWQWGDNSSLKAVEPQTVSPAIPSPRGPHKSFFGDKLSTLRH